VNGRLTAAAVIVSPVSRTTRLVGVLAVVGATAGGALTYALGPIDGAATVGARAQRLDAAGARLPAQVAAMLDLVNAERDSRGLSPLTWHDRVAAAAQVHSDDMAAHRSLQHAGTDGSNGGVRLTRAGFVWTAWGENIGAGFDTAQPLFAAWMGSTGHRDHLLADFQYVGIAVAIAGNGDAYWTLVVANGR
jgi:uncharacterized protein YkwD